jgi:CRP/FNR family transcriptional regulator, anaerobic regulatory protein
MKPSAAACFLGNPCATPIRVADSFWSFKPLRKGERLYHAGDEFRGLFQVVRGSFKTLSSTISGLEQVLDFHIPGEFMGMDAISEDIYPSTAIALEEGEVCAISYGRLNELCAIHSDVHNNLHIAMGREIRRKAEITTLLGFTNVEERVAIFLLDLLDRTAIAGRETDVLPLPMKRCDIASFLGMSGETLSRQFTKLQGLGLIRARVSSVQILNRSALEYSRGSMADARFSWTKTTPAGRRQGIAPPML